MANAGDWRNPSNAPFNAPALASKTDESPAKDKKHTHLQSSILSFEDPSSKPGLYSPERSDKIAFGSNAPWSTQAGASKVSNKGKKIDTYHKKRE